MTPPKSVGDLFWSVMGMGIFAIFVMYVLLQILLDALTRALPH